MKSFILNYYGKKLRWQVVSSFLIFLYFLYSYMYLTMTNKQFLLQVLCKITNLNDMDRLLTDILTPAEYQDITKRLKILSLAKQGKTA